MLKQIRTALDNSGNFSKGDLEQFKVILQRYLSGEIRADDAYYDLLDNDLVPMPSRCAMYTKVEKNVDEEEELKKYINKKLFSRG
ncbi:MAG: hypothetical protein ABR985_05465 [Methanotrichaceae archaeon]|jgi:hypothetical protein